MPSSWFTILSKVRRTIGAAVAVIAVFCFAGACGVDDDAAGKHIVAVVADQTGPAAAFVGTSFANGVEGSIKALQKSGSGGDIEVRIFDAKSTTEGAQVAVRAAMAAKPEVIMVGTSSAGTTAVLPILQQAQIPTFTVAPIEDMLFPKPQPWYFTVSESSNQYGEYLYAGAKDALGGSLEGKRIGLAGFESANIDLFFNELKVRAEPEGATFVGDERRDIDATTFTSQAQNLLDADPDVIVVSDTESGAALIVQSLNTAGYKGQIVIGSGVGTDAFFSQNASPTVRALRVQKDISETPEIAADLDGVNIDSEGGYILTGWTAGNVAASLLDRCGSPCSPDGFIAAAESMDPYKVPGAATFGPVQYTADRHSFITTVQYYAAADSESPPTPVGDPINIADTAAPQS